MITRRSIIGAIATATLFGAVSAPVQAATEITWWHAMGGKLGEVVNKLSEDFNASQSDYVIKPVYKGGYEETLTATIAAFRAKQQPNIVQVFEAGAATIINAKGATIAVSDLLDNFKGEDYLSPTRTFYSTSDGKMVGLPFNSSTPVMYYNKEAFKKAGVANPPKTWEEFEAIAPKLKDAGYIPFTQSHSPWILTENFHSRHNLQMATANNGYDSTDVKILFNNDKLKMHWNKMKEWKDAGYYGFFGRDWGANQDPFAQGKVAMWFGSSGSFGGLKASAKFDFGTTYLPYWEAVTKAPKQTFIGGAALFALSGHDKAENKAVAKFFEFMSSTDVQVFWHKETGYVPITGAAYEAAKASGYYKESPDAEVGILQLQLDGGEWTKGYRLGNYVQVREVLYKEYAKILGGEKSVDDAFATIEKEANAQLKRFADTYK